MFDEQFNYVASNSGFDQVGADTTLKTHVETGLPISRSGYLYVYVSNEDPNIPVYFDNLTVTHIRGKLMETDEYYPYGLEMKNISYRAIGTMQNRAKFNGGNDFEDEGELNYSNTFFRKYDSQVGRFTGVDVMAEVYAGINPYQFGNDNPVMFNDITGAKMSQNHTDLNSIWDGAYWLADHNNKWQPGYHDWEDSDNPFGIGGGGGIGGVGGEGAGNPGNRSFGTGRYSVYWQKLWNNAPQEGGTTYSANYDPKRPYSYVEPKRGTLLQTNVDHGMIYVQEGERNDIYIVTTISAWTKSQNGDEPATQFEGPTIGELGLGVLENFINQATIGSNLKIYLSMWKGNQYVRTIGVEKLAHQVGSVLFWIETAKNGVGLYTYYTEGADAEGAVPPQLFVAETTLGAVVTFGGPPGWTIGVIYFTIDHTIGWSSAIPSYIQVEQNKANMRDKGITNFSDFKN